MTRNYTNTASKAITIGSTMTAAQTSVNISDGTTFPAAPYTARIEDEIVLVTAASGANSTGLTITRGFDGTTGATHGSGVGIHPVVVAQDFLPDPVGLYLRRRLGSETAHASDDFFTAYSGYTEVLPTGTATWSASRGGLHVVVDDQSANDFACTLKAVPGGAPPLTIETAVTTLAVPGSNPTVGLILTDGTATTSNLAGVGLMDGGSGNHQVIRPTGTVTNVTSGYGGTRSVNYGAHQPFYLRLVWKSSNTFAFSVSLNGSVWSDWNLADHTPTLTPTHMGFYASTWSITDPCLFLFRYLRVYDSDLSI